jgi:hypothetical protein
VDESPIDRLLQAIDSRDVDAVIAMSAPDVRFLTSDGRRAIGAAAVREMLNEYMAPLRTITHRVTAQWHPDDVWIAEVEASYELDDLVRTGVLPRAFVVLDGPEGVVELRAYGAHERPISEYGTGDDRLRIGGQWIPPL